VAFARQLVFALGVVFAASGCAEPDSTDSLVVVVPPALEPPPADEEELDRFQVLAAAQGSEDPADVIALLDASPFSFELDAEAVAWFGEQGVPPEVLDYLGKRSKVDWSSLRGDVDPNTPR